MSCSGSSRSAKVHTSCSSIVLCSSCHKPLPSGQILARVLGRSLISEKGWVEHCASAVTAGRLGKATGDVSSRRRSLKGRFRKLLNVKRHRFMKRAVFIFRRQSPVCGQTNGYSVIGSLVIVDPRLSFATLSLTVS